MILDLGLVDYEEAYEIQRHFVEYRKSSRLEDSLIFAEHNPVFTIGRSGSRRNLLAEEAILAGNGIKVLTVDRGGDITFHGPGQIVAYPVIDLKRYACDLHLYLRKLEGVIIATLTHYGVTGERCTGKTGVWIAGAKIASIGIAATNWITYHGLSLNINTDMKFFSMINPCGMKDVKMASLAEMLGRPVDMNDVKARILYNLNKTFNFEESGICG